MATCWSRGNIQCLYVISDFLVANDFYSWHQLDHAADFGGWLGVEKLQKNDLEFLQDFMRRGKAATRSLPKDVTKTAADISRDPLAVVSGKRAVNMTAHGVGPTQATKRLRLAERTEDQRNTWIEEARLDAILGSTRLSLPSLRTGLRCYVSFVSKWHPKASMIHVCIIILVAGACYPECKTFFPPKLTTLLAWSTTFRSADTLRNYFGYVKTGCIIVGASLEVGTFQA